MSDSGKHGEESKMDCEGASGVTGETSSEDESPLRVVLQDEDSVASTSKSAEQAEADAEADTEGSASGAEGQSPSKNKKVSFHPTPIVISESEKEWDSSSKGTSSSESPSGPAGSLRTSPSAELAALHFQSREFLESQGHSDFTSDETSGDSEASDNVEVLSEVTSEELERVKAHNLCTGKEELRGGDIEHVQKGFSFAKFKLVACLRRTLARCNKELSTFDNMTKDLMASFRDLFVILCIRSPLGERDPKKFMELGSKLVEKITAKGLAAFNRQFSQNPPTGGEGAIRSWYASVKLAILKELSDMEKAERSQGSSIESASS